MTKPKIVRIIKGEKPFAIAEFEIVIVGTAPLIMHAWSNKAFGRWV